MARLRDGTEVEVRPIGPGDRDALADAFEHLSPESRYRRFFAPMPHLRERDLDYLTRVDHHDHEALVAADPRTGAGIGVARYVRTGPDVAEPAIAVADDWQGRGVGSLLLAALADRARDEGIRRFDAAILACNDAAIRALEHVGDATVESDGTEVRVCVELADASAARPRWAELLSHFAAGAIEPACTVVEALRRR
ncbi:MAG TPA: GNAT family N-acetyltransferase [Capillimicrobium sp.]|nr:GNAT family N-acetyltransferase [Capillimicrobium sp.]